MPKLTHEAIVQLIRRRPELIPQLVPKLELPLTGPIQVVETELVDLHLAEYRADAVLLFGPPKARSAAVAIEVQQTIHERKRQIWPLFPPGLHARHSCEAYLVVIALDPEVARWCAETIDIGKGASLTTARVLTRDMIPWIADLAEAQENPELAVLSVLAHRDEPGVEEVAFAAITAAHPLDDERSLIYPDFVSSLLSLVARTALEKLMDLSNYKFFNPDLQHAFDKGIAKGRTEGLADGIAKGKADGIAEGLADGLAQGKADGIAQGKAEMLLRMIALKKLHLAKKQREQILACTDEHVLEAWADGIMSGVPLATLLRLTEAHPAARKARRPPRQ